MSPSSSPIKVNLSTGRCSSPGPPLPWGSILSCLGQLQFIDSDESVLAIGFCAAPLGLLAAMFGGLVLYAETRTVTNKESGQMWQRYRAGGVTVYQATSAALQPVPPCAGAAPPDARAGQYLRALSQQNATHIFYMALLSVLSQGAVTLKQTQTSQAYLGISISQLSGRSFVVSPGAHPPLAGTAGALETHIVNAVDEWSQREDEYIHIGRSFRRRAFKHFLALEDLVYIAFEGDHPARGLAHPRPGWPRRCSARPGTNGRAPQVPV